MFDVFKKRALTAAVVGGGGLLIGGGAVEAYSVFYNAFFSPEAVDRRKREEDVRKALELQQNRELEEKFTLGLQRSADSYNGWSFSYLPKKEETSLGIIQSSKLLTDGSYINLPTKIIGELENSGIRIKHHIRTTDNLPVIRLGVMNRSSSIPNQEWILRTDELEGIDITKLFFQKSNSEGKVVSIDRTRTAGTEAPLYTVNILQPLK